jgi:hypothetical protein
LLEKALCIFCKISGGTSAAAVPPPFAITPPFSWPGPALADAIFCPLATHENMPFFHRFGIAFAVPKAALSRTPVIRRDPFTGAA